MTGTSYNTQPVGKIVVRGNPILQIEKELTEPAVSGMLVSVDGNDYLAHACRPAESPAGWISYEHTDYRIRPDSYETPYAKGNAVVVVSGGSFEIYAPVSAGESQLIVNTGDYLKSNGDGTLTAYTAEDAAVPPVAIAAESRVFAPGTAARLHVVSLI